MSTLTPKQQEIRDRETRILEVARRLLDDSGYLGLSMDAIAAELGYSRGTIYNHFSCKEEIIIAQAIRTMNQRTNMFRRAASTSGRPRQRLSAIGVAAELFVRLHPDHFAVEQLIRSASIWDKTSEKRRRAMHLAESQCMAIVAGIVRDGIAHGDLTLPDQFSPEDLVFCLWSVTFGAYSIIATSDGLEAHGVLDPWYAVRLNINRTLDGFQWEPLSTEFDYLAQFEQLIHDVFPEEQRQLFG